VIPTISTVRVLSFMTKSTTYRISPATVSTSTVKKSAAASPSQCAARKVLPRHLRPPFGCGLDAVVLQDRFHRVPRDVVAEVLQPTADASIAPGWILVRHAHDERRDLRLRGRSTRAPHLRTVVLLGDQCPVPPQDRVGRHDAGDGCKMTTAEDAAVHGETTSLVVGQAQSPRPVHRAENAVLLEQVLNDRLLMAIDPAGEQQEAEGERARRRVHWR
jgi:hypothetical protein